MKRSMLVLTVLSFTGCISDLDESAPCDLTYDLLQLLTVESVSHPEILLDGSHIVVRGESFIDEPMCAVPEVVISGVAGEERVEVTVEPEILSPNDLVVTIPRSLFSFSSNTTDFEGSLEVRYRMIDAGRVFPGAHDFSATLARQLTPALTELEQVEVYLNDQIIVTGSDFLDGDREGSTHVIIDGWFEADEGERVRVLDVQLPAELMETSSRTRLSFLWSPAIGGLRPGVFSGRIQPFNVHRDGTISSGRSLDATIVQKESALLRISPDEISLGQIIEATGRGFIGAPDGDPRNGRGTTSVRLLGEFTPCSGSIAHCQGEPYPIDTELVGRWISGSEIAYDLTITNVGGYLHAVDLDAQRGIFVGSAIPVLTYADQRIEGIGLERISFTIGPVRQIAWVRFINGFSESLEAFGLGAVEGEIRSRVLDRMQQIYCPPDAPDRCINVEFRTEEPQDFARGAYAIIDIGGPDPNNIGLFGYDNTPGKDIHNLRLWDHVGGENALGAIDGIGYGGVFVESMFFWSDQPLHDDRPLGAPSPDPLFDEVFDPVRYNEVVAGEWPEGASDERRTEIERAIHALSSVIADTAAHEFGHTLGLAQPTVQDGAYHNPVPRDGCLMDSGTHRPFEERARLNGNPGATFCDENVEYLLHTLPMD